MEPTFLTIEEIVAIHRDQIARYGGSESTATERSASRLFPVKPAILIKRQQIDTLNYCNSECRDQ